MKVFAIALSFHVALALALTGNWAILLALLVAACLYGGMYKGLTLVGA